MSELDRLMEQIRSKYVVEEVPIKIADKILKILQLKDFESYIEELVDTKSPAVMELPFWAKVWDASFLLAYFLGKQPVRMGQHLLEIGAGLGVVGIYAALCGHRVTMTDIDEDALLFARANALLNGLPQVEVRKMDWNDPELNQLYDVIFGSEVVYDRHSYPALVQFLRRALVLDGIVFIAKSADLNTPLFFQELTKYFELKQTIQTIQSGGEPQQIALYAIRSKKNRPVGH